jgi:polyhydroxyalkanoate synthesis regulator phasin
MVSQTVLFKTLINDLEENKLKGENIDALKASMQDLVKTVKESWESWEKKLSENIDEYKSFISNLDSCNDSINSMYRQINKMVDHVDPLLAVGIYEMCKRIKDDIDLFENRIITKLPRESQDTINNSFHGIRNKERLNVFLLGEFSAGKTTFCQRLISDLSGPISGAPATACLVIHKQAKAASLSIGFNDEINNSEKFASFLDSYDLKKNFELKNGKWSPIDNERVFTTWGNGQILDFLEQANSFPEAFKMIVWNHTKSGKNKNKNTFLDYADLYDMPGIAGKAEHKNVIKNVFKEHRPDVILYLIDTDRGIPSHDEDNALRELLQYFINREPQPLFYWIYQKPSGYKEPKIESLDEGQNDLLDKKFITEKKEKLKEFIDELTNGNKKNQPLEKEYVDYLNKSSLLDARGLPDDTEISQNAVSLALQQIFSVYGKIYIKKAKDLLGDSNKYPQDEIINYIHDNSCQLNNPFIDERIIAKIKSLNPNDLSVDNVRRIFIDAFCIESDNKLSDYPFDLQNTFQRWLDQINASIDEIITSIKPKKRIFGKEANIISIDRLNTEFWQKYKGSHKWQSLLFTVQSFHWLKASYKKRILSQDIKSIGAAILNAVENDIERLEKAEILLPIIEKLDSVNCPGLPQPL